MPATLESRRCLPEYELISDTPVDSAIPWLDRRNVNAERLTRSSWASMVSAWREHGFLKIENFAPKHLRESYLNVEDACPLSSDRCAYLSVPELRNLSTFPELFCLLDTLIGHEMGLHLIADWRSIDPGWHQDDYRNPDFLNSHSASVCIALRDIGPEAGSFEYVPDSHRWPVTRRDRVLAKFPVEREQDLVSDIIAREIENQSAKANRLIAKAGDVFVWHCRLVHRFESSTDSSRSGLVAHYSAMEKRIDMKTWRDGCYVPAGREGEW